MTDLFKEVVDTVLDTPPVTSDIYMKAYLHDSTTRMLRDLAELWNQGAAEIRTCAEQMARADDLGQRREANHQEGIAEGFERCAAGLATLIEGIQ